MLESKHSKTHKIGSERKVLALYVTVHVAYTVGVKMSNYTVNDLYHAYCMIGDDLGFR